MDKKRGVNIKINTTAFFIERLFSKAVRGMKIFAAVLSIAFFALAAGCGETPPVLGLLGGTNSESVTASTAVSNNTNSNNTNNGNTGNTNGTGNTENGTGTANGTGVGTNIGTVVDTTLPKSFSVEREFAIEEAAVSRMSQGGVSGAIIYAASDEGTYFKAKGISDKAAADRMKNTYQFRAASVTKSMVSTVVLQLYEEGKLSLDDKLNKYYDKAYPYSDIITIRQLCEHTSGIKNYASYMPFLMKAYPDPMHVYTEEDLIEVSRDMPPYPPGTRYNYSNTNYIFLGLIITKITGKSVGAELDARIFKPLGLSRTYYPSDAYFIGDDYAHGYDDYGKDSSIFDPTVAGAAGAVISTIDDLKKWSEALATGKLLKPQTHAERIKGSSAYSGYGIGVMTDSGFIGHTGVLPGYNTAMYYNPEKKCTIIIFFNNSKMAADSLLYDITDILYPYSSYQYSPGSRAARSNAAGPSGMAY